MKRSVVISNLQFCPGIGNACPLTVKLEKTTKIPKSIVATIKMDQSMVNGCPLMLYCINKPRLNRQLAFVGERPGLLNPIFEFEQFSMKTFPEKNETWPRGTAGVSSTTLEERVVTKLAKWSDVKRETTTLSNPLSGMYKGQVFGVVSDTTTISVNVGAHKKEKISGQSEKQSILQLIEFNNDDIFKRWVAILKDEKTKNLNWEALEIHSMEAEDITWKKYEERLWADNTGEYYFSPFHFATPEEIEAGVFHTFTKEQVGKKLDDEMAFLIKYLKLSGNHKQGAYGDIPYTWKYVKRMDNNGEWSYVWAISKAFYAIIKKEVLTIQKQMKQSMQESHPSIDQLDFVAWIDGPCELANDAIIPIQVITETEY